MFLIFALLCGITPTASSPQRQCQKSSSVSRSAKSAAPEPVTYRGVVGQPSAFSKGTGYGDRCFAPRKEVTDAEQSETAKYLAAYFSALSFLLPSERKDTRSPFDVRPNPTLSAMMARSSMLQHAAELLRYASIEEINAQHGPLLAVLDFLTSASGHKDTLPHLLHGQTLFGPAEQLPHILSDALLQRDLSALSRPEHLETAQSLSAAIEQLAQPCRKFAAASRRIHRRVPNMAAESDSQSLDLMDRICRIADNLNSHRAAYHNSGAQAIMKMKEPEKPVASSSSSTNGQNGQTEANLQAIAKEASAWHRMNCAKEAPDEQILSGFYFARPALELASWTTQGPGGRMRKILAQVASLSSDLPEGIFVRYGEGRPDILKILIVGPDDTPYERGLFEFDMLCGMHFPQQPPAVQFRTTGSGTVRFNPNLYDTGKGERAARILHRTPKWRAPS